MCLSRFEGKGEGGRQAGKGREGREVVVSSSRVLCLVLLFLLLLKRTEGTHDPKRLLRRKLEFRSLVGFLLRMRMQRW